MEAPTLANVSEDITSVKNTEIIESLTTNWQLTRDDRKLCDAVSTVSAAKAPGRLTLDEIVTDETCLILQPANANLADQRETCMIDINLTKGRRIARIGVVSEASVLEFFKESGEYADTAFAELIDEFEDSTVYFAELVFAKPTRQASIKFTRIHNSRSDMYLYGVRLVLGDEESSPRERGGFEDLLKSCYAKNIPTGIPDVGKMPDYDGNFATEMDACLRGLMGKARNSVKTENDAKPRTEEPREENVETERGSRTSIEMYIDEKFRDLENRLLRRMDEAETRNNEKLDAILKHLQMRDSS